MCIACIHNVLGDEMLMLVHVTEVDRLLAHETIHICCIVKQRLLQQDLLCSA